MRTIRPTNLLAALAVVLLSMSLVACASAGGATSAGQEPDLGVAEGGGYGTDGGQPAPSAAPAAPEGENPPGDGVGAPIDDARIVRTGTIELQVKDVPTALATARDGIRAMGGYIGASNTYNQDDQPVASITYRVPVDRWEDALDLLRGLNGQTTKVVAEQTQAVEVTGAVVDLEARIKNLQASEAALQDIAAKAVRVTDVLEVQNQLTQVRGEIESLTAQLKDLEDRADYATLSATFQTPIVAVEVAQQDWDPKTVVDEASASLIEVLQAITSAGIWFVIVWLPILLVLGAIALIVTWVVRRMGIVGPRRHKGGGSATPTGEVAAG
jgi:hypothetical protein